VARRGSFANDPAICDGQSRSAPSQPDTSLMQGAARPLATRAQEGAVHQPHDIDEAILLGGRVQYDGTAGRIKECIGRQDCAGSAAPDTLTSAEFISIKRRIMALK